LCGIVLGTSGFVTTHVSLSQIGSVMLSCLKDLNLITT